MLAGELGDRDPAERSEWAGVSIKRRLNRVDRNSSRLNSVRLQKKALNSECETSNSANACR